MYIGYSIETKITHEKAPKKQKHGVKSSQDKGGGDSGYDHCCCVAVSCHQKKNEKVKVAEVCTTNIGSRWLQLQRHATTRPDTGRGTYVRARGRRDSTAVPRG